MINRIQQYVVDSSKTYRCHVDLADSDKPIAAIAYQGKFYSFFRTCPNWETAEKIASRMKGEFVITEIKKGWAIWAFEF
jgi:hypothetical protein